MVPTVKYPLSNPSPEMTSRVAEVVAKVEVPATPSIPEIVAELKVVVAGMLVKFTALP